MLVAQIVPVASRDVLLLPIFLCLFGGLFWWMGTRSQDAGGKGWSKYFGALLLALAVLNGLRKMWDLYNPSLGYLYRASISRNIFIAHFVALLLPVIISVWFAFSAYRRRRLALDTD